MKPALLCAIMLSVVGTTAQAQRPAQSCFYIADAEGEPQLLSAASRFAFPFRIGQPATDQSRAVHAAFERNLADDTRSIGAAWRSERTAQGMRYFYENGLAVELAIDDCSAGLVRVRAYLEEVEFLAEVSSVRSNLQDFRLNVREVSAQQFHWASPPIPVAVERSPQ